MAERLRAPRALLRVAAFAIPLVVYLLGFHYVGSGDTKPAELLPITLLRDGDLDFREFVKPEEPFPYWYHRVEGRVVSSYPILPGLLNMPVFAVADLLGADLQADDQRLSMISASVISALSVLFVLLALEALGLKSQTAFCFALVYAFATCVWSVTSRGLWQHGPSLLFLTSAVWLLLRDRPGSVALAGLFLGLAVVNRPSNALIAVPLAVYVFVRRRPMITGFAALLAVPFLLHAAYASAYLGSPFSSGYWNPIPQVANFRGNPFVGLVGLLVSPSRGLFVFSPIFLFSIAGAVIAIRQRRKWPIAPYLAVGAILLLLLYSRWSTWWGGHAFGYRYLIETLPALIVLLALAWEERVRESRPLRAAFFVLLGWSVFVNGLGSWSQPSGFNQRMDEDPSALWSVRNSEIAFSLKKLSRVAP